MISFHWLSGRGGVFFLPDTRVELLPTKKRLRRSRNAYNERIRIQKKKEKAIELQEQEKLKETKLDEEFTEMIEYFRGLRSQEIAATMRTRNGDDNTPLRV